ncbi:hypothetical protein MMC27_008607 [Xylographa pallens]|nr:hypothetical protein [Xylographa pallens]
MATEWVTGMISNAVSGAISGTVATAGNYAGSALAGVGNGINGVGESINGTIRNYGDSAKDYGNYVKDYTKAPGARAPTSRNPLGLTDSPAIKYTAPKPQAKKALPAPSKAPASKPSVATKSTPAQKSAPISKPAPAFKPSTAAKPPASSKPSSANTAPFKSNPALSGANNGATKALGAPQNALGKAGVSKSSMPSNPASNKAAQYKPSATSAKNPLGLGF